MFYQDISLFVHNNILSIFNLAEIIGSINLPQLKTVNSRKATFDLIGIVQMLMSQSP